MKQRTHLRDSIVQTIAAAFPIDDTDTDYSRGVRAGTLSSSLHAIERLIRWTYEVRVFSSEEEYRAFQERMESAAVGVKMSWDGWEHSYDPAVDGIVRWIEKRLDIDLAEHLSDRLMHR